MTAEIITTQQALIKNLEGTIELLEKLIVFKDERIASYQRTNEINEKIIKIYQDREGDSI